MAIEAHLTGRYSAQRIVSLTNPDDAAATTSDATRLTNSAADVEAEFKVWAGTAYDNTDARHIAVGVECLVLKLRSFHQNEDPDALRDKRKALLEDLAKVTGRDRIVPATDGVLQPSSEQVGTEPVLPDFDRSRWGHLTPDGPAATSWPDNR